MKRKDGPHWEDLPFYEAGLDADGFEYWLLFGEKERREREARRQRKKSSAPPGGVHGELTPGVAILFVIMAVVLLIVMK